jgi:hypothetical protein
MNEIVTVQDAEAHREEIESFAGDMWATDQETGRVEWEEWTERFEKQTGIDLPEQWDDPAMVRVKRIAKAVIREIVA